MNLEDMRNKEILLFGKSRAFSTQEFSDQMKFHEIKVVQEYSDDVVLSVDGRMMTPYEQNASDELYEKGSVATMPIERLEKYLAQEIDEDTLLMSLKLSHDKERLKSFIQNEMISDTLFLRLVKLYSWSGEDFFENDDNRDVSAAFIARFYENIERNHNVQYSTTGFIHLVAQVKDTQLLKTIASLKPLEFHPKIETAIAMSIYCDEAMQKQFFKKAGENILEALSFNKNLAPSLIEEFVKDEELGFNVARSIELTDELFEILQAYPLALAINETLSSAMQEKLFSKKDKQINYALSLNHTLDLKILQALLALGEEEIVNAIYENNSTPQELLEKAYKEGKNYLALAKNENTPIEILYQLQLDARYERSVKTNAAFGRHIQSENIGWEI